MQSSSAHACASGGGWVLQAPTPQAMPQAQAQAAANDVDAQVQLVTKAVGWVGYEGWAMKGGL